MLFAAVSADKEQRSDRGSKQGEREHTHHPVGIEELGAGEALNVGHRYEIHRSAERGQHTAVIRAVDDGKQDKRGALAVFDVALSYRLEHGHCYGAHHRRHDRIWQDGREQRCDDEPDKDLLLDRGADKGERARRYALVNACGLPCHAYDIRTRQKENQLRRIAAYYALHIGE